MAKVYYVDGVVEDIQPKNGKDFKLEELRDIVEGWIEILYLNDGRLMVINEEGKLEGLDLNVNATNIYMESFENNDIIVGNALVCDKNEIE